MSLMSLKKKKINLRQDNGSIMMEYVIVTLLAAIPIFLVWHGAEALGYPGVYDMSTGQLKGTGLEIQAFFQQVMAGIAMPLIMMVTILISLSILRKAGPNGEGGSLA